MAVCGGDPGGEGGMAKLGTVGKVRFCMTARLDVYGEPGGAPSATSLSSGGGDTVGPFAGPLIGRDGDWATLGGAVNPGAGTGTGAGAGAGAFTAGGFANSILVAIKVPAKYIRVSPWPLSRPHRRCSHS